MKRKQRNIGNRIQLVIDEMLHLMGHSSNSSADVARVRSLQMTKLEERVLMSVSPMGVLAEVATVAVESSPITISAYIGEIDLAATETVEFNNLQANNPVDADADNEYSTVTSATVRDIELIVIDSRVQDANTLLENLLNTDRNLRLLRLDANSSGLTQISDKLQQLGNVSAIHLLTHGNTGEILLGSTVLNADTLAQHAPELVVWQHNLTANADILLYGCDVAATTEGKDFVESLHKLTGADVAASVDATGHEVFGGNWDLEYSTGVINSYGIFTQNVQQTWLGKLASITVTTFDDVVDGNTSSVANLMANKGNDGAISLREAILAINAGSGGDTINLGIGTYTLSRLGSGEDLASTGDLDILKNMSIYGVSSSQTIIDGSLMSAAPDRLFDIKTGATVTINGVTLTRGSGSGGVLINTGASLTVNNVVFDSNTGNDGGGLQNNGTFTATSTVFRNNSANNGAGFDNNGTTTLTDVEFISNAAGNSGGGLRNSGTATLNRVTFKGNTANNGAGIYNNGAAASLTLTNTTISGNTAESFGGGFSTGRVVAATNVTIAYNTVSGGSGTGGGVYTFGGSGNVNLTNSIIANNTAVFGANSYLGLTSSGYNIVGDATTISTPTTGDQTSTNPNLDPTLRNNGGFTQTHALLNGSSAINAGTATGAPTTDQRGKSRIGQVDIGAYEFEPPLIATGELAVNVTTGASQETSGQTRGSTRAVSITPSGNYVVVWTSDQSTGSEANDYGVLMRTFRPDGTPLTGEIQVNQTIDGDQQWATVATDDAGNGVVVWTSTAEYHGNSTGVYARRFDAAGVFVGNEFRINTTTSGTQENAAVAMSGAGAFVVTWSGNGLGDTDGVFYRRFDASGNALDTAEQLANATDRGEELAPVIAMNDAGQFAIAWHVGNDLYTRNFAANGTAVTADIQVDSSLTNAYGAGVGIDALGRTVVVYRTDGLVGVGSGVWARAFNWNGTQRAAEFSVASGVGTDQTAPSIAMDDAGNFIVTYQSSGDGSGNAVFVQRYDSNFNVLGSALRANITTAGNQQMASVAMRGQNNYVVVWSGQGPGDSDGVLARQFSNAGTAPVITSNGGGPTASINVPENTKAVTIVTSTDIDGGTAAYSIVGGADQARLVIDSATGVLRFSTAPNFEMPADANGDNIYIVRVQVSDGNGGFASQTINVRVVDIDEAPTANAGGPYVISEGGSLTVIAGSSVDPEGLPLSYAWDIDGDGLFTDATGNSATLTWNQLKALANPINDNGTRTIALRVTDAGGNSTVAATTLTINNTAPTVNVTGDATTTSGTAYVINFATSDPGADTIATYQINWGDGVTQNAAGTATSAAHTYLTPGGTRSITVNAIDEDGTFPMTGGPLVVAVNNTTPTALTLSDTRVAAFTKGAMVGTLSFHDPDFGDSHTWTVSDNRFKVDGAVLMLKSNRELNPATEPTVTLTVTVTDASGASNTANFTLRVNNPPLSVADAYAVDGTQQLSISNPSMGILANDSDADNDSLTANLVSGPSHAAAFGLNANGTFWYRAVTGYSGLDSFLYQPNDATNAGAVTTVTLTVNQPATLTYTSLVGLFPNIKHSRPRSRSALSILWTTALEQIL